jgi:hypothetical protein
MSIYLNWIVTVKAVLKGERQVNDADIGRYKNLFAEGLDYLRNFQPDADELFSKKLRFSPGDDANKLPAAIANFGELTVALPQFAGRFLPMEQSYIPRPFSIGLESDSYKCGRKTFEESASRSAQNGRYLTTTTPTTTGSVTSGTSSGGGGATTTSKDDDHLSIRYRRRQQMEEEAWNRLRGGTGDGAGRRSPNRPPSRVIEDGADAATSPWSRINQPPPPPVTIEPPQASAAAPAFAGIHHRQPQPAPEQLLRSSPARIAMVANDPQQNRAQSPSKIPLAKPPTTSSTVAQKPPLPRQASSTDDPWLN